ncbi:MAG: S-adenosylmethionine decarboxylase proenzyme [Saprospiraceae bacterium]|nr:MAG: S-adenosylmethionine decarboxylase proenzyme [Saprospiraceae bacterium]
MECPKTLGRHLLLELHDCPEHILKDTTFLESSLCQAAELMGATVVTSNFHTFSPYGVSGVVIIQESHLTIHSWPEHGYAAIDIFTCGQIDLPAGADYLMKQLKAGRSERQLFGRGPEVVSKVVG